MPWTPLPFGKYRGRTLPQIVLTDPDYFFWAFDQGVFQTQQLKSEAAAINNRACHIAIPNGADFEVEYSIHPGVGKLAAILLVPKGTTVSEGPVRTKKHLDLSVPRQIAPYDKMCGKIMLDALKRYVFSDPKIRLTSDRCEAFFDDDRNFVLEKRGGSGGTAK
jgi:hypothetical protein